jgi:exopolyphosphatase/pppGpp-phosphohydrolase
VAALGRVLEPRKGAGIASALDHAARVLDIGRSVDVINRHEHVADILLATDLAGFTRPELMLLSAIVRRSGDRHAEIETLGVPSDHLNLQRLDRAAVILALADEIEQRCPRGTIPISCEVGRRVTLSVPSLPSWRTKDLDHRFERAFGRALIVRPGRHDAIRLSQTR